MALSKVALECLQGSSFFTEDILFTREGVNEANKERQKLGEFHTLYEEYKKYPQKFYEYTRMRIETFDYILEHIAEHLEQRIKSKRIVTHPEKLFLTLRYMAHGLSFKSLSQTYRLGRSTVSKTIYITLKAIWKTFVKLHLPKPTLDKLENISEKYFAKWQFPNCIGSIDVKNFRVKKHFKQENSSLALQTISDAECKFVAIEFGGKEADDGGFQLNKLLSSDKFDIPPQKLPNSDVTLPLVLIGNESFPLKTYLMRPYPMIKSKVSDKEKIVFNQRLSRAQTINHTLKILSHKWRVLMSPLETSVEHARLVIKTACLLHNIVRDKDGNADQDFKEDVKHVVNAKNVMRSKCYNRSSARAIAIRDQFKKYFVKNPLTKTDKSEMDSGESSAS